MRRRILKIVRIAARQRLDAAVPTQELLQSDIPTTLRWFFRVWPGRWLPRPDVTHAVRLRRAFEELGPVFIKFGQLLSTRRDLLPEAFADELAKLQDNVPPFAGEDAQAIARAALGPAYDEHIAQFDLEPIASASIAQIHGARLTGGEQVVVKVVRPDIDDIIRDDLEVLAWLAKWIDTRVTASQRLHLPEVVSDYASTVLRELDMLQEATNTQQLRENFAGSPLLYVPRVHHQLTRSNVLVIERISGIPIGNIAELKARGTNLQLLANRGVETFFKQVFVDNFFHADMHPGNIFVDVKDPEDPQYIALDCAIIGTLTKRDQDYLARNLMAFFNRDYGQVARLHLESGWIPSTTDEAAFERVIREVCDPIFAKPLNEISFGHFLIELFRTAAEFNMEIQPQLVLLQKTLLYVEGLGRQLYPQLDLWETAKPFMEQWMQERVGPLAAMRSLASRGPEILAQLPRIPELILDTGRQLSRLESGLREQQASVHKLETAIASISRTHRVRRWTGAALIAAATVLLWEPISLAFTEGTGVGTSAGLLSAIIGSFLLVRA